jgi:hypothetical protein
VRRFSRLDHRLPKFREKHGPQAWGCQRAEFCMYGTGRGTVMSSIVAEFTPEIQRLTRGSNYSAATRRCTTRKYAATSTRTNPFTPNTTGAVNIGTSHPVTRFPMGIPPRKAQL